jgi:hypothetical protein
MKFGLKRKKKIGSNKLKSLDNHGNMLDLKLIKTVYLSNNYKITV